MITNRHEDYTNIQDAYFVKKIPITEALDGDFGKQEARGCRIGIFGQPDRRVFTHSEMITIPYHFFEANQGTVLFFAYLMVIYHEDNKYGTPQGGGEPISIPFINIGDDKSY